MKRRLGIATVAALALLALAAFVTPAAAASQKNLTKVYFLNMGVQPVARGKLMMVENKAQTFLKIKVKQMDPGTYDVVLDGAVVDSLTVAPNGKGQLTHRQMAKGKAKKAGTPLPYNPAGGEIEIRDTGTALLVAEVPSSPDDSCEKTEIQTELANLGVVPGKADAEFEERCGRMSFEVELDDAPTGLYDLMVDGVKVADIVVGIDGDGQVEFDSMPSVDDDDDHDGDQEGDQDGDDDGDHPDSPGVPERLGTYHLRGLVITNIDDGNHDDGDQEGDDDGDQEGDHDGESDLDLLLTFDPRGKLITIVQNGVDLFSATFPLTPAI